MRLTDSGSSKHGRNSPCSCGSGKKYKKCCLNNENTDEELQNTLSFRKKIEERHAGKQIAWARPEEIGNIKMSAVILEFADELLEVADTYESQKKVIMLAIMAWNLALDDKMGSDENLAELLQKMCIEEDSQVWNDLFDVLRPLIKKKRTQYASIDRRIMDFEYKKTKRGGHLNVVSAFSAQPAAAVTAHRLSDQPVTAG